MSFEEIRKIDNSRGSMPKSTFLIVGILLLIGYWFFRGGSFVLYASMFFGLYSITTTVWLSIILVSLIQNIAFLPLRIIGEKLLPQFKDFEEELEETKQDEQYLLMTKKIHQGNRAILIYLLNFVLVAIAFVSAGRVFLLDFYYEKISKHYLYPFIHYPHYPLEGTIFSWPAFKITQTMALPWGTIAIIWGSLLAMMVIARLLWVIFRRLLTKNKRLLSARIAYNHLLIIVGGFIGTLFIGSMIFFRHIPTALEPVILTADLSRQNTTFNIITAVATFMATIYMGYSHNREGAKQAKARGIPQSIIAKVLREKTRVTIRNAFFLAIFAYVVTHQMPSSHDLSVLAFESIYILSPFTIDAFFMKKIKQPVSSSMEG